MTHLAMHTTNQLTAAGFSVTAIDASARSHHFEDVLHDWQPTDRMAVVSPDPTGGIHGCGLIVLAITTCFYEAQRARNERFFVYPLYFALLGLDDGCLEPDAQQRASVAEAWGNLDVWPDSNWRWAPRHVDSMLEQAAAHRVNHLLWPASFGMQSHQRDDRNESAACDAARRLRASLRTVLLYDTSSPTYIVHGSEAAKKLVNQSLAKSGVNEANPAGAEGGNTFESMMAAAFFERLNLQA